MNTNRFLAPPPRRRSRFIGLKEVFWAGAVVFAGLLLGVLYCLLTNQIPV